MPDRIASRNRRWRNAIMTARLLPPYLIFAVLKRLVPLPRLVRWAWLRPVRIRDRAVEDTALRCTVRLRNWFGADRGDCLQGSLALYRVLSHTGSNPRLVVGFRRDSSAVGGHAWVEVDGACVIEAAPPLRGFVPAFSFGPEGALSLPADATGQQAI
ncbi:MAG: lasso peptide biosynthesis B2 protein [Acidobacteriota bacterium]